MVSTTTYWSPSRMAISRLYVRSLWEKNIRDHLKPVITENAVVDRKFNHCFRIDSPSHPSSRNPITYKNCARESTKPNFIRFKLLQRISIACIIVREGVISSEKGTTMKELYTMSTFPNRIRFFFQKEKNWYNFHEYILPSILPIFASFYVLHNYRWRCLMTNSQ